MTSGALEFKSIGYYDNHLKVSIPDKCITLPKVAPALTVTLNENLKNTNPMVSIDRASKKE